MNDLTKAQFALDKAKMSFLSINGSPFLATILFGMKQSFSTDVPTLATNGTHLIINPDFFLSIPEKQREAELAHECWHVALDHISRLYDRDHDRWNIATDYAINIMMHDSKKFQLGSDWLLDEQYRGMSSDIIYTKLQNQPKPPNTPSHMQIPKDGDGNPMPEAATRAAIEKLVSKAATVAKQQNEGFGFIPGGLETLLEPILKPKLNWKTILLNHVSTFAKNDYSYRRFNRRYLPDFYMPTLYSEAVGEIAAAFDASGSVSDDDFRIMLGQVKQIQQMLSPEKTSLVTFDTQIQNEYTLTNKPLNSLKFNGRGGTDVQCVFEHFKKRKPKVLIIFSDMDFRMPTEKPNYPVIWIGVGVYRSNITVPFGKYIEIPK